MIYKAVIADVDGTIIPPSENPATNPSQRLVIAVEKVRKAGVVFSIASARSRPWVTSIIDNLKLDSPIILDNGARIYHCGEKKYIWESFLQKEKVLKIFSLLKKDPSLRIYVTDDETRLDNPTKISKWKVSKIIVLGISPKRAEELYQALRVFPDIHVTKSVSGIGPLRESIHVTNSDATKQVAVVKLADFLGIKAGEIIGIGDSYNDFPLLMSCGLKVAMENAIGDIKNIADYIAPSCQEDGVAHVLEKFIIGEDGL